MKDLKVTFIQTKLHWKDIDANLKMFGDYFSKIKKGSTDLILLPEMFSTGFIMVQERWISIIKDYCLIEFTNSPVILLFLGIINAPARNIAQVIAGGVRQVVNVIDAYAKKDESAEAEAA